jgi:hypothetical protein
VVEVEVDAAEGIGSNLNLLRRNNGVGRENELIAYARKGRRDPEAQKPVETHTLGQRASAPKGITVTIKLKARTGEGRNEVPENRILSTDFHL